MSNDLSYIHESLKHLAIPVADLTPDPKNARKHDRRNLDAIKASLEKFGMRQPIIVQKQGMIVRAGNGRLQVAQELGWSHLPALVVDESEAEAVAFAIADNRTAELAEWDWEVLKENLQLLQDGSLETPLVGFSEDEVAVLFTNNDWEGLTDAELERPSEEGGSTAKHEQNEVVISVKVTDPTARVDLLKALKRLVADEFQGRAVVG